MKNKAKYVVALILAIVLSASMIAVSATSDVGSSSQLKKDTSTAAYSQYAKIDINSITGQGENPPEISGTASAIAAEKEWYEYVMYSSQPVSSIRIDDNRRLVFYDPYDYANAMIMEVTGQENDWSSANSLEISYTTGNSLSTGKESSQNTSTSIEEAKGKDENYAYSVGISTSVTQSWSQTWSENKTTGFGSEFSVGGEALGFEATVSGSYSKESGYSFTEEGAVEKSGSESATVGWTQVANRVTKSTGSSSSINTSWSTEDSKTISQVYNAAYFNEAGSPLQWKIVQYTVYMPMKYELQHLIDGEWVSTDSAYCILTTMQGTCRAYMKNTQAYIEHWGTGEPIIWDDFWDGFFTKESLLEAYKNKLYPTN